MATVPAGKTGRIDRGNRNDLIIGIKQVQGFSEDDSEVQGFYSDEEFLKRGEVGHY
jgi:hypothetical protein